jgi:hypothetical protein
MTHNVNDEALHRAINKWEETAPIEVLLDINALKAHMLKENGIKIQTWITGPSQITVVDQVKYTMFLLRYGS